MAQTLLTISLFVLLSCPASARIKGFLRTDTRLFVQSQEQKLTPEEEEVNRLIVEAKQLRRAGQPQQAIEKFNQALTLAEGKGDHELEAGITEFIGQTYRDLDDNVNSLKYLSKTLQLSQTGHFTHQEATVLNDLGNLYIRLGDADKALSNYNASLSISQKANDAIGKAAALIGIGDVYGITKDFDRAFETYKEAADILHEKNAPSAEAVALKRMSEVKELMARQLREDGDALNKKGELQQALTKYEEALGIYKHELATVKDDRTSRRLMWQAAIYHRIGKIYLDWGNKEQALANLNNGLSIIQGVHEYKVDRQVEAELNSAIGSVYFELEGNAERAINYSLLALKLSQEIDDVEGAVNALTNLGTVNDKIGEKKKGLDYYSQAVSLSRSANNLAGEAHALANMGAEFGSLGQKQEALDHLSRAVQLQENLPNSFDKAEALSLLGTVHKDYGDLKKALEYYNRSLKTYQAIHDATDEIKMLVKIGGLYFDQGNNSKATEFYDQALKVMESLPHSNESIGMLSISGRLAMRRGANDKALDFFNRGLELSRRLHRPLEEASMLNAIGAVYKQLGEIDKAGGSFNQSLKLMQDLKDSGGQSDVLNNLSALNLILNDPQKALKYANESLRISRAAGDRPTEAATLSVLGELFRFLRDWPTAHQYFNLALVATREIGSRNGEAAVLIDLGLVYQATGNYSQAAQDFQQALTIFREIEMRSGEAQALHNLGSLNLDYAFRPLSSTDSFHAFFKNLESALTAALKYFDQALEITREIHDRFAEADVLNNLGVINSALGDEKRAFDLYKQSAAISKMFGFRDGESVALANLGYVCEKQGNYQQAVDFYLGSISLQEMIRESARLEEFKVMIAEKNTEVYQNAALLQLQLGNQTGAFDLTERARARTLLDQLGNTRINVRNAADPELLEQERLLRLKIDSDERRLKQIPANTNDQGLTDSVKEELAEKQAAYNVLLNNLKAANLEYASLRSIAPLRLSEIQSLIDPNTTLVSYFVTPNKTLAFVITKASLDVVQIPVKKDELHKLINWFRSFDNTTEAYPESLKQLDKWLVAPIRNYLRTSTVGVIPHDILHYVPFAALTNGQTYFGEEYTLFTLPSASVLPFILKKSKPLGDSLLTLSQNRAEGLPFLEQADNEAKSIAELYGAQPLVTPAATKSRFLLRAGDFNILHIAAHAKLNPVNPLFSYIYLAPDNSDNGLLTVGEIYDLNLTKASLVVLSACETELGSQSSGDDIVGMNRAFLYAGTPTVVSSLWTVDDESTGMLMESFYSHLKNGDSKAVALRVAQHETRAKFPNPYYWAAFVLTGDPGQPKPKPTGP